MLITTPAFFLGSSLALLWDCSNDLFLYGALMELLWNSWIFRSFRMNNKMLNRLKSQGLCESLDLFLWLLCEALIYSLWKNESRYEHQSFSSFPYEQQKCSFVKNLKQMHLHPLDAFPLWLPCEWLDMISIERLCEKSFEVLICPVLVFGDPHRALSELRCMSMRLLFREVLSVLHQSY